MQKLFPKAEEIPSGAGNAAGRKLPYSSSLKTGKLNREQYKYDSAGNELWARRWDGPIADAGDAAEAIVVDFLGNVYVTGGSWQGTSQQDIVTIKYDNAGNQLWISPPVWDGTGFYESAWDIDVDSSGNVYVTGMTHVNGVHRDCVLIKYDSTGAIQWAMTYDGGLNGFDAGYAVVVDSTDNYIYVAGTCTQTAVNKKDCMILKYNSAGNLQAGWPKTYNGAGNGDDELRDIAYTGGTYSYVYATGVANDNIATDSNCITIKYQDDGTLRWEEEYDNGINGDDEAEALVVDGMGLDICITGSTDSGSGTDYLTVKYNSTGNWNWTETYDSPASGDDHAYGIDLDENYDVYVTGHSSGDYATVKYSKYGGQEWAIRYNGQSGGGGNAEAIAVYDSNSIYVTGDSEGDYATIKYNKLIFDPNPPKWVQLPDLTTFGIDVNATAPYILADDFSCTRSGYITKIVVWGSWLDDYFPYLEWPEGVRFTLSIHDDIPDPNPLNPDDWSMPGDVLWLKTFEPVEEGFTAEVYEEGIEEGWMNPPMNWWHPADWTCWKYTFTIDPGEAFYQEGTPEAPIVYWLDVQAEPDDPEAKFGWKTSLDHWNDDAVWGLGTEPYLGPWNELRYPPGHELYDDSIDLAFAITTEVNEPEPEPKEFLRHLKWSQPPIEIDPDAEDVTFCGWDEKSFDRDFESLNGRWKIVADDFRCLGTMPITSIHWWGSYYGWEVGIGLPTDLPTKWWVGFWSNIPENIHAPYSYPEVLLKDFVIDADRVEIVEVGKDEYYGEHPNDICYQYYVDLREDEIFRQHELLDMTQDDVFWISIVAIYEDGVEPLNPWGWKTRQWHWMDDAVTFNLPGQPAAGHNNDPALITPLKDPVWNESVDVSFEFDTDPNYIKWEQDFNGIRNWPHYEDVKSTYNEFEQLEDVRLVADDWRCLKRTPVTAIVWWGSYIGYRYQACSQPLMPAPTQPNGFRLTIYTDVPAGADPQYDFSHPGREIWEYMVMNDQYDEVLVGFDKHPHPAHGGEEPYAIEPVFRYSIKLPEHMWFRQPDFNEVFWLSVQAIYNQDPPPDPYYPWGWTNHEHVFNDDAVQGHEDATLGWVWDEVHDQTGASADMSFVLFTDPDECVNCPDYNIDLTVNFFDYADFADDWAWTGPAGGYNNSDLDCDGKVDVYDLALFVQVWLAPCP